MCGVAWSVNIFWVEYASSSSRQSFLLCLVGSRRRLFRSLNGCPSLVVLSLGAFVSGLGLAVGGLSRAFGLAQAVVGLVRVAIVPVPTHLLADQSP